jgi:undecaprenyl-phosphate 4-deoxy-4-formamido-L-arabinose transferase
VSTEVGDDEALLEKDDNLMTVHPENAKALPRGISVVVPVFQGADCLVELLNRLEEVLRELAQPHEVVLVNDGSTDESWRIIVEQATRRPWVRGINLMRNYGQHNALLCGIRAARFSVTITMDDDLQNPPEDISKLLDGLEQGSDVVYGVSRRKQHALGHVLAAKMLRVALATVLGAQTARLASPFRAFRTRLRDAFERTHSPWVIVDVYLTWATANFSAVEVSHDKRHTDQVSYTLRKRFNQALDMVTGFSTVPLKLANLIGFLFTLFGVGVLVYVLTVWYLSGRDTVPGFAFLASTIAIFSGAQLFALGILGEYLARMFQRVMDRPPYAVFEYTPVGVEESDPRAASPPVD